MTAETLLRLGHAHNNTLLAVDLVVDGMGRDVLHSIGERAFVRVEVCVRVCVWMGWAGTVGVGCTCFLDYARGRLRVCDVVVAGAAAADARTNFVCTMVDLNSAGSVVHEEVSIILGSARAVASCGRRPSCPKKVCRVFEFGVFLSIAKLLLPEAVPSRTPSTGQITASRVEQWTSFHVRTDEDNT